MIRSTMIKDLPEMLEISNWAALHTAANFAIEPEPLDDWRRSFDETASVYPWLVAIDDAGAVTGFAKSGPWKGRCAYAYSVETTVYVHPEHHRRGIGRELYAELFPMLEARGFRSLVAGITLPNPASVRLHENFGFTQVACFERIGFKFGRWHDVGYWMLHIGGDGPPEGVPGASGQPTFS